MQGCRTNSINRTGFPFQQGLLNEPCQDVRAHGCASEARRDIRMESSLSTGIVINGRFLTQRTTGVQRYAREMVNAIDAIDMPGLPIELICPPGAEALPGLRQIRQSFSGFGRGQAWEQLQLPWFAAGRPLVCLCNLAPILCLNRAVVIHDAAVFDAPGGYGRLFTAWYRLAQRALVLGRAQVITVSQFSRGRLVSALGVPCDQVEVVGGAVDHVDRVQPDLSLIERLSLQDKPYLLAIGSLHPNKNIGALETAMADPRLVGLHLVVVGGRSPSVFRAGAEQGGAANVHYTGYASDEQLVGLLKRAKLFVFPSVYEGFGLPPLEAMRLGCPVLASRATAIPQVCGDAAAYFDPTNAEQLASAIADLVSNDEQCARLIAAGKRHVEQMTWNVQAQALLASIGKRFSAVAPHRPKTT